jgi:hypothetical protein
MRNDNKSYSLSNSAPLQPLLRCCAVLGIALLTACAESQPVQEERVVAAAPQVPDFSGVWMAIGVENPEGGGNAARFTEAGQARLAGFIAQFSEFPEAGAACVGSGMPGVMLSLVSYPIEIVQNASRMLMVAELETQVRRVFIDGRQLPPNSFPTNQGHSFGTWDGDTLVIESELFEVWPLRPWPRSEDARITERVYLTTNDQINARRSGFLADVTPPLNDDVLVFDITITDPAYYDGPQRRIAYYQRMPDEATSEYACSQGLWYDDLENYRISE